MTNVFKKVSVSVLTATTLFAALPQAGAFELIPLRPGHEPIIRCEVLGTCPGRVSPGGPILPDPTPPPAPRPRDRRGEAAAIGAVGGFLLGTLAANAAHNNSGGGSSAMQKHIAFCSGKYKTYDPTTNKYMSFKGPRYCNSPYL